MEISTKEKLIQASCFLDNSAKSVYALCEQERNEERLNEAYQVLERIERQANRLKTKIAEAAFRNRRDMRQKEDKKELEQAATEAEDDELEMDFSEARYVMRVWDGGLDND